MWTARTTASTTSRSQTGMACFKLWLYWLMLGGPSHAAVKAPHVVTFLFSEHLFLRWFHFFDHERWLVWVFLIIVLKWDLVQLLYQKNIQLILVEGWEHAPQEDAFIF